MINGTNNCILFRIKNIITGAINLCLLIAYLVVVRLHFEVPFSLALMIFDALFIILMIIQLYPERFKIYSPDKYKKYIFQSNLLLGAVAIFIIAQNWEISFPIIKNLFLEIESF